jgi:hypothetical protein
VLAERFNRRGEKQSRQAEYNRLTALPVWARTFGEISRPGLSIGTRNSSGGRAEIALQGLRFRVRLRERRIDNLCLWSNIVHISRLQDGINFEHHNSASAPVSRLLLDLRFALTIGGNHAKDVFARSGPRLRLRAQPGVCTENLNPGVVMMKSAEYRVRTDDSSALNRARDRRIFIQ